MTETHTGAFSAKEKNTQTTTLASLARIVSVTNSCPILARPSFQPAQLYVS